MDESDELVSLEHQGQLVDVALKLPTSGRIEQVGIPALLRLLFARAFTGRVDFRRDAVEKALVFDDGYPVFARSNAAHDRLGELLLREGRVDEDLLTALMEEQGSGGRRLGALLVERGVVKEDELFPLVRRHVLEIFYSLFSWRSGRFTLVTEGEREEERIRLKTHPAALIVEGIRRKVGLDEVVERLGGEKTRVRLREGAADALASAGIEADELEVVKLLAGEQTLGGLISLGILDPLRCYQLIYALWVLGLVIVHGEGVRDPYGEKASRRWRLELSIDGRHLRTKMAQVEEGDYFAILGLRSDASRREVVQAYRRLCEELDPEALAPEFLAEHGEALSTLRTVVEEAFWVLGDDRLREAYRAAIAE